MSRTLREGTWAVKGLLVVYNRTGCPVETLIKSARTRRPPAWKKDFTWEWTTWRSEGCLSLVAACR